MLQNTAQKYGKIAKYLHWLIAAFIICLLFAGFTMINLTPSPQKWQIYGIHKATGLLVLSLVFIRFIWRIINVTVDFAYHLPFWMKIAANLSHYLLYITMFVMPLSGIGMSLFGGHEISFYGLFVIKAFTLNLIIAKFFALLHFYSAILLVFLITLHITAAIYHHVVLKDDTLLKITIK